MTQTPRGPDFGDASEAGGPPDASTAQAKGTPEVPDFGDAPEFGAPAPDLRGPSSAEGAGEMPEFGEDPPVTPGDGPDFADYQEPPLPPAPMEGERQEEAFATPVAAVAPRSSRPDTSGTGRMRAIVGGITILAILAIGLAVFLPREKSEKQPQAGTQTTDSPTPSPMPTQAQQYRQQASEQDVQSQEWARQAHQAFLEQRALAETQNQSRGQGQGQAVTGNTGGNQTAGKADGGTGYKTCPDCGGEGTKPCPMKHLPNGHMLNPLFWAEERYYSGRDPLLPEDADMGPCPYCGGRLRVPCDPCHGQGQIPDLPAGSGTGARPGGSSVVDGAIIDSVARQLMGAGGQ